MSMFFSHFPALAVVIPLLAAPIVSVLGQKNIAWTISTLVSILSLMMSISMAFHVQQNGPISYLMGGWAAPWGIEYVVDPLSAFLLLIISGISSGVLLAAKHSIEKEIPEKQLGLFYAAYLLSFTGMMGISITGDAFNIFVFLEISALSGYVLIAMGAPNDRRALTAAFQYLIIGTIGATFILIAIGLIYMMTGTLNIADIASRFPEIADTRPARAAVGFAVVGIAIKLALFPFHIWLPNGYSYAPSAVTAVLAGTATKVSVYLLIRFLFTIFGIDFSFGTLPLSEIIMVLAVIGFLSMSTVAIFQNNLKRMLAYSSVAQLGYMALGIGLASEAGLTSAIVHMFNHAIIKTGMFLSLASVFYVIGSVYLKDLNGLGRRMPLTTFGFVIGGLGLIGVPLTAGFISKWYLILAALEAPGLLPLILTAAVLISSLLAVIYIWRVVEVAYFRDPPKGSTVTEAPLTMRITSSAFVVAGLYFGVETSLNVDLAAAAARFLLGGGA